MTESSTPHEVDVSVGARIRILRRERGLSQARLAEAIGVSFQQIQKYERGTNRVSASRLTEIASTLGVAASDLLGDAASATAVEPALLSHLATGGAAELLEAYVAIRSPDKRRALIQLARVMGGDE